MNSSTSKTEPLPRITPLASRDSDLTGGRERRRQGLLLLAVLILGTVGAVAQDAAKDTKGDAAPAAGSKIPLLAPPATQASPIPGAPGAVSPPKSGAKIQFATPIYDFGKVTAGETINYTFSFTNVGTETLQLASVVPSCGCTTAGEWSRTVEPGKTGTIPIRFNTGTASGPVGKTVTVNSNDPNQPAVVLQVKGTLWLPIDVTPRYAMLNATTESPSVTATVRITNSLEQPLTISPPESNNRAFEAELKTIQPGREFEVIVKTVPPLTTGSVNGTISLKTSSTNMPTITITAFANVQQVVTVSPPSILLPAPPMVQALPAMVTIRNTSTNAIAVSEPSVNAPGVDVQLKEVAPGHHFTATVTFPSGFEIAPSNHFELSLKSNHPQFPTIKVPIQQAPRPVPPATPVAPVPSVTPAQSRIARPASPPVSE